MKEMAAMLQPQFAEPTPEGRVIQDSWTLRGKGHLFHGALTGDSFTSVVFSLILLLLFNYHPLYPSHIFTLCCIFCLLTIWLLYILLL